MSDLWEPCQFNDESHVYCEPPSKLDAMYDDLLLKVTGNMLVEQKIEVAKMICNQLNENAALKKELDNWGALARSGMAHKTIEGYESEIKHLREQIATKDEALWQAAILADIASDWNLDEIEIDGEMVLTYDLHKRFMQAREGSSAGEDNES